MNCQVCGIECVDTSKNRTRKYCSPMCQQKAFRKRNPNTSSASGRNRSVHWSREMLEAELARQGNVCYGCLSPLALNRKACVDHDHKTGKVRGILCSNCNLSLGLIKDSPGTLRRLMSYLDYDRDKLNIYLVGALKNDKIPEIANRLRIEGWDVMDEWWTPGPDADTHWQEYERRRGRTYGEALKGRAATNIFWFDRSYIDHSDVLVLVMPAGRSCMLELGYAKGRGKRTYILMEQDMDRYEVMPNFADAIVFSEEELIASIKGSMNA